jgi:hypothetical protein
LKPETSPEVMVEAPKVAVDWEKTVLLNKVA